MITVLQGRNMSNEQVLDVLRRSCSKYNQKLIHAQFDPVSLELVVLVDYINSDGSVETDMEGVLIGIYDLTSI